MREDNGMKKTLYIAIAFAALFAVSCQKEKELHPVGSRIVFSAATEFMNARETRTIYTGEYTQTTPNNYERIQWVANDPITILYSHGSSTSANYTIDGSSIGGSGTAKKSTASISASGTALSWEGGNSHIFYGLYPTGAGTLSAGSVNGLTMPATQTVTWNSDQSKYLPTMTNAIMVAYKDMSSDQNSTVNLPFTPVVNAIEFRLHLPDDRPSYTVTQVQFSHTSTAIAGPFNVSITGFANDAVTWTASSNSTTKKILVNFSPANPAVPTSTSGSVLDFTVLTLPVSISDPILQIKYSDGHVLKLTLTGLSLQPGQKCIVTNSKAGHDDFTYEVSDPSNQTITGHTAASFSQINVSSIKRSGADNTHTEPVGWKVQYNDNGTWRDGVPSGYTLSDDHTNNRFTVSLDTDNTSTTGYQNGNPFQAATQILKARTARGSASSPWDLSTHDLAGGTIAQTTANCYVITAPGVYKFPLIYGNARLLGQDNPSAYSPKDVSAINSAWGSGSDDAHQNYYLPAFYNATGDVIDSPYILTDLGNVFGQNATVAGKNGTGSPSVHFDNNHSANDGILTNCSVQGSGSSAYIQFEVTEANIKPGNVRLLLEGSVTVNNQNVVYAEDIDPVLWSWHIWVTDKSLAPSSGSTVMPFNLGWVDANTTVNNSVSNYTNRTVQLRIAQVEGGSEVNSYSDPFTLTQNGDVASINNPLNGTNPHYQWGRKDPYAGSASTIPLVQHNDAGESNGYWYWRGIRMPHAMFKSEKSTTWMDGKAIPLYKGTQTPSSWTVKTGTYGPFTGTQSTNMQSILGTREMRRRVKGNSVFIQYFSSSLYTWSPTYTGIPTSYWSNVADYFYYFADGIILTAAQMTALQTCCNTAGGPRMDLGVEVDNYSNFLAYCVENVFYFTVSSPITGLTEAQKNTLINNGFPSSGIQTNYTTTYNYTTDAERKLGSILHNLWSAALYNENASVTKYKTVYDPCPAGFTVPTKATYNSGTFTGYPRTGRRYNNSGTGNISVTDNGTKGYYWTDHPSNMSYNSGAKDAITSYSDYDKSYILETTSSTATVKKNIRATAASIRPMVDPHATAIAGNATPAQLSATNSIEGVTMGGEL